MEEARIIVQAQVWNNAQFLTAPIMAIHKFVDEIQLFDGAYQYFHDEGYAETPESTDGSKEIFDALKLDCDKKWFPCDRFWKNEIEKKEYTLRFWKQGEWRYTLSDDEIPSGSIEQEFERLRKTPEAMIGWIPMVEARWGYHSMAHSDMSVRSLWLADLGFKPRFLRWQEGLRWQGKHHFLVDKSGIHRNEWPKIHLWKMCLLHLKFLRPPTRTKGQLGYEALNL